MSAGHVYKNKVAHQPDEAVSAAAACHKSTLSKWLSREKIVRRMTKPLGPEYFDAAINAGLIENRGFSVGPGHVGDEYRLTDAGWEMAGGKPIWL